MLKFIERIDSARHSPSLTLIGLWLIVTAGFFLWRSSVWLIWCDTSLLATNLFEEAEPWIWSDQSTLKSIFHYSFYDVGSDGYRPLARTVLWAGTAFFSDPKTNRAIWFAGVSLLIGCLAVVLFLVARRFLRSQSAALLAVFLFLFSTPVVSGAWNVFCGVQIIVPLLVCLGLVLYWNAVEASQHRLWYWAGLCAVLFFGPWFREFIGLLPLLIIFLEFQRAKRPTFPMAIAAVFFLHAIYPALLVKATLYPDLPLKPVFAMGHLGAQVSSTSEQSALISRLWFGIRWDMAVHFLTLYPPLLLAVALIALLHPALRVIPFFTKARLIEAAPAPVMAGPPPLARHAILSAIFIVGAGLVYFVPWRGIDSKAVALWLCGGLGLVAIRRDSFLAWWFGLFFAPFLWVFTEQVHLAYSLVPASIIVVAALEDLWKSIQGSHGFFRAFRYAVISVIILTVGDHVLNPYNSYRVVKSVNDGIFKMANWFRSHVPEGSIVVTNALHGEDIRLFSDGHIKILWTVRAGIARNEDTVADPNELEELLKRSQGKNQVYFLDMDFNYTPDKVAYHSHKYVRNQGVAMQEMGLVHTTRVLYPYLDPLKAFVSRPYMSFLGAPDLENDFYRGPAQDRTPFLREVYAEYHVYRVTGTNVDPWDPNGPSKMVKAGYRGFDILEINGRYFAIPEDEGPFDVRKAMNKGYSKTYQSDHYEKLISEIERVEKEIVSPEIPR